MLGNRQWSCQHQCDMAKKKGISGIHPVLECCCAKWGERSMVDMVDEC